MQSKPIKVSCPTWFRKSQVKLQLFEFFIDVFPKIEEFVLDPRCLLLIMVVMSESGSGLTTIHCEQKIIYNLN